MFKMSSSLFQQLQTTSAYLIMIFPLVRSSLVFQCDLGRVIKVANRQNVGNLTLTGGNVSYTKSWEAMSACANKMRSDIDLQHYRDHLLYQSSLSKVIHHMYAKVPNFQLYCVAIQYFKYIVCIFQRLQVSRLATFKIMKTVFRLRYTRQYAIIIPIYQ